MIGTPTFLDPTGCNERTSYGSEAQLRDHRLKEKLSLRDGDMCVVTGYTNTFIERAHLLPHSRGDDVGHSLRCSLT